LIHTGNVGIGTTSPAYKLDVSGESRAWRWRVESAYTQQVVLKNTNTSGSALIQFQSNNGTGKTWLTGADASDNFIIYKGTGAYDITVTNSGNVGIGTASPAYKLDVSGTGRFTGALYAQSTLTASGQAALNGGAVIPADKTLKIGDCEITWDSDNNALKFNQSIYSTSEVTAYGIGSSASSGGGASALSDLNDVALGTLSSGQLLRYDGAHWVNIPESSITPDLTGYATEEWVSGKIPTALPNPYALAFGTKSYDGGAATEITASDLGAATTSDLAKYLPLSGGTMTGDITVNKTDSFRITHNGSNNIAVYPNGSGNGVLFTPYRELIPYGTWVKNSSIGTSTYKWEDAYFSGTVNATTFNGSATQLGGVAYQNILERSKSGSSSLSGYGWYRIAQCLTTDNMSGNFILSINRNYSTHQSESMMFAISYTWSNVTITQLSSATSNSLITKIRVFKTGTNTAPFVDFYLYSTSGTYTIGWTTMGSATSYTTAEKVDDSPSGTIYEHNVVSNSFSTNNITATTINARTALQENGTALSSKYLQLSGGTMTGDIISKNNIFRIIANDTLSNDNAILGLFTCRISGGGGEGVFLRQSDKTILPANGWISNACLGNSDNRFKDAYFSGTIYATTFSGALSGNATTATTATKLGTSTVGSATLPIYLNAGTATACTAASIFSNLSNSGNNLSITVAGLNKTLTVGYATNAGQLGGISSEYFGRVTTIDASSLNVDYYYPVTFSLSTNTWARIDVNWALGGTVPSWSTHSQGYSCNFSGMMMGSGWGSNPSIESRVLLHNYAFCSQSPLCNFGQMTSSSTGYIYVRGGGRYIFRTDRQAGVPTLRTADYTVNSQTVSVKTAIGEAITPGTGVIAQKGVGTVGSATLPMYLNNGTFTACTGSSIFSGLANSGNNLSITVAGQNRTLTVAYATSAGSATSATTATTATKLGTSTVGSATLPVYINAGTATACTASSIFSALAMSGNNLSITVAGQNRTLAIGYATNAGTATNATNATNVIVNYHNVNDTNYPMIWSNQVNTSTVTANQLYKSSDFHYNPANGRLSAKVFRENGTDLASKYAAASHTHSYAAVSHTHSEYLPIAGGTATGTITAPKFVVTNGPLWRTINGYNCPVPTLVYRGRWATGDTSIRIAYQDPFSLHSGFTYSSSTGKLTLTHTTFKTKVGVGFDSTNLMIHVWPYGSKRYALTYDRAETKFSVDSRSGGDNANTEFILEIFIIT
jgi:hypothetical protein